MTGPVHTKRDYERLLAAVRLVQKDCGGLEACSVITGRAVSQHGRYQSPHDGDGLPVHLIADLEAEAGAPHVTRALAKLAGCVLVTAPPRCDLGPGWGQRVALVAKETSEATAKIAEAFAVGGAITRDESETLQLRREIGEAVEALLALDEVLKELEGGGDDG